MAKRVAIVGATGAVGEDLLRLLQERRFPVASLRLFASAKSAGSTLKCGAKNITVEDLAKSDCKNIDIAIFSAGAQRSRDFAWKFAAAGAVVIDNSSAFRMEANVPLVIPEINPQDIKKHQGVIANPNCSTIIAALALWPLHKTFGLKRFTVATYQAASGAGRGAMLELQEQARRLSGNPAATVTVAALPHQIAFNVIPQVDVFLENGYTKEEMKFVHETHKIFGDNSIKVSATCVRVPTLRAHAEAIQAEFNTPITPVAARAVLGRAAGVRVEDDPASKLYPMPWHASGKDNVFVGRLRQDVSSDNGLVFWVVGDQLRKGAALNAVQIAELLQA